MDNDIDRAAQLIQEVGAKGMLGGVAIKPGTPVDGLLAVMDKCAQLTTPGLGRFYTCITTNFV